jgi:tetratricopeptide (TPR) repeat protein
MRQRRAWAATLLAILCMTLGSVAPVHADARPTEAARKEASEHFLRGVELYQEGAFRAALVEFERAYGIAPDYRLLYNIGQVKLQLQDYLGATQSYERYLAEGGAEIPQARRDDVETAFQILGQRVGRLSITASKDGAELFVDDLRVGVTPLSTTVAVNVGRHRVYARAEDGVDATQVIDVAGGDLLDVALELKAHETKPLVIVNQREPLSPKKRAAIGSWALGGAALVGAAVTAFMAQGKVDERNKELDESLPNAKEVADLGNSADTLALTTDVLAGACVLAAGAGVVFWLLDDGRRPKESKTPPVASAHVQWGIGPGTVTAKGHF